MINTDILEEPFKRAFEQDKTIDYEIKPFSGVDDHKYFEELGYTLQYNSDSSVTVEGIGAFSLSSYGTWGTYYGCWADDKAKEMFLDMVEKEVVFPWRIR